MKVNRKYITKSVSVKTHSLSSFSAIAAHYSGCGQSFFVRCGQDGVPDRRARRSLE